MLEPDLERTLLKLIRKSADVARFESAMKEYWENDNDEPINLEISRMLDEQLYAVLVVKSDCILNYARRKKDLKEKKGSSQKLEILLALAFLADNLASDFLLEQGKNKIQKTGDLHIAESCKEERWIYEAAKDPLFMDQYHRLRIGYFKERLDFFSRLQLENPELADPLQKFVDSHIQRIYRLFEVLGTNISSGYFSKDELALLHHMLEYESSYLLSKPEPSSIQQTTGQRSLSTATHIWQNMQNVVLGQLKEMQRDETLMLLLYQVGQIRQNTSMAVELLREANEYLGDISYSLDDLNANVLHASQDLRYVLERPLQEMVKQQAQGHQLMQALSRRNIVGMASLADVFSSLRIRQEPLLIGQEGEEGGRVYPGSSSIEPYKDFRDAFSHRIMTFEP